MKRTKILTLSFGTLILAGTFYSAAVPATPEKRDADIRKIKIEGGLISKELSSRIIDVDKNKMEGLWTQVITGEGTTTIKGTDWHRLRDVVGKIKQSGDSDSFDIVLDWDDTAANVVQASNFDLHGDFFEKETSKKERDVPNGGRLRLKKDKMEALLKDEKLLTNLEEKGTVFTAVYKGEMSGEVRFFQVPMDWNIDGKSGPFTHFKQGYMTYVISDMGEGAYNKNDYQPIWMNDFKKRQMTVLEPGVVSAVIPVLKDQNPDAKVELMVRNSPQMVDALDRLGFTYEYQQRQLKVPEISSAGIEGLMGEENKGTWITNNVIGLTIKDDTIPVESWRDLMLMGIDGTEREKRKSLFQSKKDSF